MRAVIAVVLLSFAYLVWVFRLTDASFWSMGLGDWMDPYFTNALMEHWYQSLVRFRNPASPPMYYPVDGTLGYSHGLILYVPFYAAVRPFLHPFPAQSVMLLLVVATGAVTLFLVLREHGRLSSIEAGLLTAFFVTSRNVINGETGVWLQRASVFLIPAVLLLVLYVWRMPDGRWKLALAWCAGLLSTLLLVQDFQTAVFAALLLLLTLSPFVLFRYRVTRALASVWGADRSWLARGTLIVATVAAAWTSVVVVVGGMTVRVGGITVRSHDWWRPTAVAIVATAALLWIHRHRISKLPLPHVPPSHAALALGAVTGLVVFLWIYVPALREHYAFPEQDLLNLLKNQDPGNWRRPADILHAFAPYSSMRSFVLILAAALIVWLPPLKFDRETRLFAVAVVFVSLVVVLLPLRFDGFSLWRSLFWPLPGFSAIRDPARVITEYELGVVLVMALFGLRHSARVQVRRVIALLLLALIVMNWNPERFDYIRTTAEFDRWVEAPIDMDPRCTAFFTMRGPDEYLARPGNSRAIYGIESLFIALRHSIPTLNGYSAWFPNGWGLAFPEDAEYLNAARTWIDRHSLTGVCAFDVRARSMQPF